MPPPTYRSGDSFEDEEREYKFEGEEHSLMQDNGARLRQSRGGERWKAFKLLLWIIQALLLATNIYGLTVTMKYVHLDRVTNPMRAPIRYVTKTMFDEQETAPYQAINGSSTSDVDGRWNEILDVGAVKMDTTAKTRLHKDTARVYGEDLYAGILEFEHQLHCLNRIRKVFYGSTLEDLGGTYSNFTRHNDHCFQYLRQVIMCHADVEVMSMDRVPQAQGYAPDFHVVKQCRDFNAIYEWARELPAIDQDAADGSRLVDNNVDRQAGRTT